MFAILTVFQLAQGGDTTATKAALLSADRDLARATIASPNALLDRLEPGAAVLIPGDSIFRGAERARAGYEQRYVADRTHFEWTPLHAVVSTDGRFGCTTGTSTSQKPAVDRSVRYGRYLTCWRAASDGTWHIVVHARNGEAPVVTQPAPDLNGAPHSATGNGSDLRGALDADSAFARLAVDSGPGPAFARFAAEDAMLLGGLPTPRRGPHQIREGFANFPADQRLTWAPIRDLGAASGGLAVTVGTASVVPLSGPHNSEQSPSKYVTVWRREGDGSWRYIFDLGSARPAHE
jgi:ketosteroid isomerase-like protein